MCIDKYLAEACPDLSRSYVRKLLKSGRVLVNGQGIKASYIVVEGDRIEPEVPKAMEPEIDAEPMDLGILYEDQDVTLINKPKDIVVHPAVGHYNHTLVNGLMYHYRDRLSGISGVTHPGIVHRIGMNTAGVIIICKDDMTHSSIAAQFEGRSITRRYQTIVHGVVAEDEGAVGAPIGRHPVKHKKMNINYQNGEDAVTHYGVLNRFRQYTHMECRLETGRIHQIRIHMASIHHPLLGDAMRGPTRCPISGLCGQTLCAGALGSIHPRTEEYMELTVPLPEYFDKLLRALN